MPGRAKADGREMAFSGPGILREALSTWACPVTRHSVAQWASYAGCRVTFIRHAGSFLLGCLSSGSMAMQRPTVPRVPTSHTGKGRGRKPGADWPWPPHPGTSPSVAEGAQCQDGREQQLAVNMPTVNKATC